MPTSVLSEQGLHLNPAWEPAHRAVTPKRAWGPHGRLIKQSLRAKEQNSHSCHSGGSNILSRDFCTSVGPELPGLTSHHNLHRTDDSRVPHGGCEAKGLLHETCPGAVAERWLCPIQGITCSARFPPLSCKWDYRWDLQWHRCLGKVAKPQTYAKKCEHMKDIDISGRHAGSPWRSVVGSGD